MKRLSVVVAALLAGCGGSSGSSWSQQDTPAQQFPTALTVWVSGEDDIWLGGATIWHNNGSGWTETPPATPTGVVDFWGFSPNDVWAISNARVLHWDGAAWTDVAANNGVTFDALWRLWGSSGQDIWIANTDNSRVFHYDGATWTRTTLQFVMADALWGSSPTDIWLSGTTDLYHYAAGQWMKYDSNDAPPDVLGLWGFGPNDVWAAGNFDDLSHWNGSTWTPEEDVGGAGFNGIWGAAPDDIYAVGDLGFAGHYDGDSWSVSHELGNTQSFTMVHGSGPDNVWATAVDLAAQKAFVLRKD